GKGDDQASVASCQIASSFCTKVARGLKLPSMFPNNTEASAPLVHRSSWPRGGWHGGGGRRGRRSAIGSAVFEVSETIRFRGCLRFRSCPRVGGAGQSILPRVIASHLPKCAKITAA